MTIYKALHPRDPIERLYKSRKGKVRWLACIEAYVDASIKVCGIQYKEERLIKVTSNNKVNIKTNRKTTKTRKQKKKEKQLYGYFNRQIGDIA